MNIECIIFVWCRSTARELNCPIYLRQTFYFYTEYTSLRNQDPSTKSAFMGIFAIVKTKTYQDKLMLLWL